MQHQERASRRLGILALVLFLLGFLLAFYGTLSALPYNPIPLPFKSELQIQFWFPQGWKFFTRDAREDDYFPYLRAEDGTWKLAATSPNFQASNLFGLSRNARAQGVEVGLLTNQTRMVNRIPCHEDPAICLERASVAASVENMSPRPTLCGDVGLVFRKPVPWAWSEKGRDLAMPATIVRLEVKCSSN